MNINHVFRFEKLRDGGSLIVSFQSDDSCEYWVIYPAGDSELNEPEYNQPMLINRTTGIEVELSRAGAKQWLKKLEPLFHAREELPHVSKKMEEDILNQMLGLSEEIN